MSDAQHFDHIDKTIEEMAAGGTPQHTKLTSGSAGRTTLEVEIYESRFVLFHGTSSAALPGIRKRGLLPGAGAGAVALNERNALARGFGSIDPEIKRLAAGAVHVTIDRRFAETFANYAAEASGGSPRLLRVIVPMSKFRLDETLAPIGIAYRYEGVIGSEFLVPADEDTESQWNTLGVVNPISLADYPVAGRP